MTGVTLHQAGVFALAFGGVSVVLMGVGGICRARLTLNIETTALIALFAFGAVVLWG